MLVEEYRGVEDKLIELPPLTPRESVFTYLLIYVREFVETEVFCNLDKHENEFIYFILISLYFLR